MEVGGVFERSFDDGLQVEATTLLGSVLACVIFLVIDTLRRRRAGDATLAHDSRLVVLCMATFIVIAMLALPGAVRAHHQLNVLPLLHALVAIVWVDLWRRQWRTPQHTMLARTALVIGLCGLLLGQLSSINDTRTLIDETRGRGRWTSALAAVAQDLDQSGGEAVSLDWGFHEPLLFLTRRAPLREAIWEIPTSLRAGRPWFHDGDADTTYLVHDVDYDLFKVGPRLLDAAREPGFGAMIEPYVDQQGEPAFYTVKILRPHRLVFNGRFEIQ
jgi:hypothetical protein